MLNKILFVVVLCCLSSGCVAAKSVSCRNQNNIYDLIDSVKFEKSTKHRLDLATMLPEATNKVKLTGCEIDDALIDDLASLLADNDDIVRLYAAIALGQIGPRAARAVPALKRALANDQASPGKIGPDFGSAATISKALEKIQGHKEQAGGGKD